jgi:hypothetical protein
MIGRGVSISISARLASWRLGTVALRISGLPDIRIWLRESGKADLRWVACGGHLRVTAHRSAVVACRHIPTDHLIHDYFSALARSPGLR